MSYFGYKPAGKGTVNSFGELKFIQEGLIDANNSSSQALLANNTFTGVITEILNYGIIYITVKSDVASATDGLSVQQSPDGNNWDHTDEYTINANTGKTFSFQASSKYFRVVYTNGTSNQTYFRLQTLLKKTNGKPSSHRIKDTITSDDDAELQKSILAVQTNDDTTYVNVDVQNPIPSDGDSVYGKDLILSSSSYSDFTIPTEPTADLRRILTSFVSDIFIAKVNSTANNPKTVELYFRRPVSIASFGINSGPGGFFKNTKVTIKQGEYSMVLADFSADSTPRQIQLFAIVPVKFSSMLIEFHTADEISIGLIGIFKSIEVAARLQAIKSDNTIVDIGATDSGNLKTSDAESGLAIAQGIVVNTSFIHKFGKAPDFDNTDGFVTVWDGANDAGVNLMQYVYSTIADIDRISSDNGGDTFDVEVQGLDANYNMVTQTKTLTGTTPVPLDTALIRIFRMKNVGTSDNLGRIFCFVNVTTTGGVPNTLANIRAIIQPGNNQTLMAIFTIPAGYKGYMRDWYASLNNNVATSIDVELRARPFGQVFQVKHTQTLNSTGTSSHQHNFTEPEVFTEKTDIVIRTRTAGISVASSAGFDLVLKAN